MDDEQESDRIIRGAITQASFGSMCSRYVLIAETVDPDTGEQLMECLTPETQPIWDDLALIEYARTLIKARIAQADTQG